MTNPGTTDLIAYWRMDEKSGTRVDSHDSYNCTPINSPGYGVGRRGKALNLIAASNQMVGCGDSPGISMGSDVSFCMGLWFKSYNISSTVHLMSKGVVDGFEYLIKCHTTTGVSFVVRNAANTAYYQVTASNFGELSNDMWYFVSVFYWAPTAVLGVGVNDVWNTASGPSDGVYDGNNSLFFGGAQDGYYLNGLIDEAFIYKYRYLTPLMHDWMYNSGYGRTYSELALISPPPVDLVVTYTAGTLEVYVLDPSLKVIGLIEDYYSLTWAERYAEAGDFELELPIEYAQGSLITFGNFLYIKSSNTLMIIEDIKPSIEEEKSNLVVKGQSAESLLKRRILLDPINVSGPAEIAIYSFIENHITDPGDSDRRITLFATGFPAMLTTVLYEDQHEIQTVYDVINLICKSTDLGFKIVMYNDELVFYVYEGEDRSYDQSINPYVIFSDDFDNVITSSFYESEKDKINIVLVATNDNAPALQRVFVWEGSEPTDIDRHEQLLETTIDRGEEETKDTEYEITVATLGIVGKVCLDAVSITVNPEMGLYEPPPVILTDSEVLSIISTRGSQLIKENKIVGFFEGDFDIQGNFEYGVDFFMGDVVQCNLEGRNVKARIVELVRSYSTEGEKSYVAMDFII